MVHRLFTQIIIEWVMAQDCYEWVHHLTRRQHHGLESLSFLKE
jgi:hypothetical protein